MKLSDCNRKELLEIIDYLKRSLFTNGDYRLLCALQEVERKRRQKNIDESERYNDISYKKRMEAVEILREYDGKPIKDIPLSILERADKCLKEAQDADEKWESLQCEV